MSIANAKTVDLRAANPSDIDALFRFQLPDDMSQLDELKLVDPYFFVPPFQVAPLICSNPSLAATNQYARKRELVQSAPKPATGAPLKKVKTAIPLSLDFKDDGEQDARFRTYQKDQWTERFEDLCAFVKKNGHSLVPNSFQENPSLAHWTKRRKFHMSFVYSFQIIDSMC